MTSTNTSFAQLALPDLMVENLNALGYSQMTPIQAAALPLVLGGQDVIAQAKTGSGKTAAFTLGLLTKINPRFFGVQGLILCPTRELSTQVAAEIRRLARYQQNIKVVCLCGGQPLGPQIASLEHGAHIVVGTPGRIIDHLDKNTLDVSQLHTLVLDEADRMLDMGFIEAITRILQDTPSARQTLLFSATYPDNIQALSRRFQREPARVEIVDEAVNTTVSQHFVRVKNQAKLEVLAKFIAHFKLSSAVIFCNTKVETEAVTDFLNRGGYNAKALHGDCEQRDRDQVLIQFKHQSLSYLVATDVAARGLDIDDLPAVINYDLTRDPEVYVHRIGRTARAGKTGLALTLLSESEDYLFERIEKYLRDNHPALAAITLTTALPIFIGNKPGPTPNVTLHISAGRKEKIRPGDILGALTGEGQVAAKHIGKIDITEFASFVAVERAVAEQACQVLNDGKIKGRKFKVRMM